MKKLTIREARQSLSHLDRLLEEEGEITITRRGKPIGRVIAINGKKVIPSHKELRMKMRSNFLITGCSLAKNTESSLDSSVRNGAAPLA